MMGNEDQVQELKDLKITKIRAEIASFEAETNKNTQLAENARLEALFRARRLSEELCSLEEANAFHFFGPVTPSNCALAIESIGNMARKDSKCDITIVFNSPGGSVWEGLALFDFLRDLSKRGNKIITKSMGMAASMGGVLLQAGDERIISPHGFILIHEISSGNVGKVSEMEDYLKLTERLQEKILGILAERSTLNKIQIRRAWKRKDYWIDAEEALKLGFVDKIED